MNYYTETDTGMEVTPAGEWVRRVDYEAVIKLIKNEKPHLTPPNK